MDINEWMEGVAKRPRVLRYKKSGLLALTLSFFLSFSLSPCYPLSLCFPLFATQIYFHGFIMTPLQKGRREELEQERERERDSLRNQQKEQQQVSLSESVSLSLFSLSLSISLIVSFNDFMNINQVIYIKALSRSKPFSLYLPMFPDVSLS